MASKHSYVVNAKEPSTITHSLVANFTAKDQTNVIVAKSTIFEVYVYNEEKGLELVEKHTVNGRIKYLAHFRFPNEDKDLLLVLTDRHRLACLSYDEIDNEKKKKIVTRCHREITQAFRQPLDEGQIILVNTTHDPPFILHHLYHEFLRIVFFYRDPRTGLFKFTRSEQEKLKDKSSQNDENREEKSYVVEIRLTHETHIFDLKFHPTQPTMVLMLCYDDRDDKRCLKTYKMSWPALPGAEGYADQNKGKRENTKTYEDKKKVQIMLEEIGTRLLLGEKGCKGDDTFKMFLVEPNGVVLLGERSIKYTNLNQEQATPLYTLKQGSFKCYCPMEITDDKYQRFLFGVHSMGRMLMLKLPKKNPSSAKVEYLHADGDIEVSVPDRLHQVIESKVFVASLYGNSQLIELDNNKYKEVQSFDNMGPILDMSVVEIDQQKQVVACANAYKHGTLRVLKVGIGVSEKAYSHLPPVDGIWSVTACPNETKFDDTIVISNIKSTRCVRIQEEGLVVKADIKGFLYNDPTVYCANLDYQHFIQVTANSLLLFKTGNTSDDPEQIYLPRKSVTIATNKKGQIVLALGNTLFHCHRERGLVVFHEEKSQWEFEMNEEISCIEIADSVGEKKSDRLFVGFWLENTVKVFSLPYLNLLSTVEIDGFSLPRVLLATSLDKSESLLCATGDGGLLYYNFKRDTDTLELKVQLDSENDPPVGSFVHALHEFEMDNNYYVFACTDRPNLISCPEKSLKYQNLNLKEVTYITSLHAQPFQNSMAIITEGQLIFLQINEFTTRLHVDTHPIHETPRRIVHQPSSKTFGLVTSRTQIKVGGQNTKPLRKSISWDRDCNPEALGTEIEVSTFLLLDQNSLNLYGRSSRYRLDENEYVFCMTSCKLNDTDYFVLGTGVMEHPEAEQTAGRIILLIVQDGELRQACEVKNPKHAITAMSGLGSDTGKGHRLVTAELGKVSLWRLDDDGLKEEAFYEHTIKPVYLITRGETRILIGDIFNSVTRLEYDKDANEGVKLKEKAHDFPHMHAYTWEAPTDDPNFERGVVRAMRYEMACVVFLEDTIWLVADKSYNFRMMVEKTEEKETIDNTISPLAGLFHLGELVNVFRHGSLVELPESKSSILFGTPVGSIGVLLDLGGKEYELLRELQTKIDTKIEPKHVLMNLHNNEWRMFSDELQIKFKAKNFVDGDLIESLRETFDADTLNNLANEFDHNDEEDGEYDEFTKLERLMIKADNMKKFH